MGLKDFKLSKWSQKATTADTTTPTPSTARDQNTTSSTTPTASTTTAGEADAEVEDKKETESQAASSSSHYHDTVTDHPTAPRDNEKEESDVSPQTTTGEAAKPEDTAQTKRPSNTLQRTTSPAPIVAPVTGASGIIGESTDRAEVAALALTRSNASNRRNSAVQSGGGVANERDGVTQPVAGEAGAEEESQEEEDIEYPPTAKLLLISLGLALVTFVVALDNTIIATAIPKITSVFNSLDDVGWYGSAYLLTCTSLQPPFGRIYTYFNLKWTYLSALVIFELGSVLCAAATSSVMLIIGRAVAGAGASALFSGSMTIVGSTVPLRKRPLYIAILSSMFGISSVIGPLLGGAFTDGVSWRWCFWINLPFGAVAFLTVGYFYKPPPRKETTLTVWQRVREIDILGTVVLIGAIVCLLLALQWGGSTYPWNSSKVWGNILGFGLLITVFIAQQFRRKDRATIPPKIFGQRSVFWCSWFTCFLSMALFVHIYYLPFYFQAVKGVDAEESGIRTIPYLVSNILASIVIGASITIFGFYKPFMIAGGCIFTIGAGMIYLLQVDSPTSRWIGYQLLAGIGAGIGIQVPFIAIQVVLSAKDMPTGNAAMIFFNTLGGAISISIAQNVFSNGLKKYIPIYAPNVNPEIIINAGATYLREVVTPAELPGVLEGYMKALQDSFILPIAVGGLAAICACFVEWKSVKGKKLVPGAA